MKSLPSIARSRVDIANHGLTRPDDERLAVTELLMRNLQVVTNDGSLVPYLEHPDGQFIRNPGAPETTGEVALCDDFGAGIDLGHV